MWIKQERIRLYVKYYWRIRRKNQRLNPPLYVKVWSVGGDGWGYDMGYGGVDRVLASGENIKLLIMDTEVYSNTGGQMSKATPLGAIAQFAAGGKMTHKKNIGLMMATYGKVYVAQVAFGANLAQTVRAITEAEAYNGPALIVAYSGRIDGGQIFTGCPRMLPINENK
ncbi:MAG: thiamine pyrophosphate-dependent enzyme, partial [Candidatus Brocadiaceae bacterium]